MSPCMAAGNSKAFDVQDGWVGRDPKMHAASWRTKCCGLKCSWLYRQSSRWISQTEPGRWCSKDAESRTACMESEEDAMATFDQPEVIEPEIDETGSEAGSAAPATGDGPASDESDDLDVGGASSGSGFVSIAVGLAALLPLPVMSRRRC